VLAGGNDIIALLIILILSSVNISTVVLEANALDAQLAIQGKEPI